MQSRTEKNNNIATTPKAEAKEDETQSSRSTARQISLSPFDGSVPHQRQRLFLSFPVMILI